MKLQAQIYPGLSYGFTTTPDSGPDSGKTEHCVDFLDQDAGSRIFHVRLRLFDRTLAVNYFVGGAWGPEQAVVLPPATAVHLLHVRFGEGTAIVTCDNIAIEMPTHCTKAYEKISAVDLRGFVATPGQLDHGLPGGENKLELTSLEYAILEARLIRLEAKLAALTERLDSAEPELRAQAS